MFDQTKLDLGPSHWWCDIFLGPRRNTDPKLPLVKKFGTMILVGYPNRKWCFGGIEKPGNKIQLVFYEPDPKTVATDKWSYVNAHFVMDYIDNVPGWGYVAICMLKAYKRNMEQYM